MLLTQLALVFSTQAAETTPAPVVANGSFAEVEPGTTGTPAGWEGTGADGWSRVDADGYDDHTSLHYKAGAATDLTPVTQSVELPPGPLVLSAALKPGSTVRPVIVLRRDDGRETELARLRTRPRREKEAPAVWEVYQAPFDAEEGGPARLEIRLETPEAASPESAAGVDAIEILSVEASRKKTGARSPANRPPNLAPGKPYTYSPQPNYPHTADPSNATSLTDGIYTSGYFWTQKTTVGWIRTPQVEITLDLGDHHAISGVALNSAAGAGGVKWPSSIRLLVSVDGKRYHEIGDLVALSARKAAPPRHYATHRFETDGLHTHGRYLKLIATPGGTTFFADEIEIYQGEEGWKTRPLPGPGVVYGATYFEDPFNSAWKGRLGADLGSVVETLAAAKLDGETRTRLTDKAQALEKTIRESEPLAPEGFVGIYPLTPVHSQIYALLGEVRQARGRPPLTLWQTDPWYPLKPAELVEAPPAPRLTVSAMQGETRAATLNLTNNTPEPLTLHLAFEELPQGAGFITVREVLWTDTAEGITIGSALPELKKDEDGYLFEIPAGMTRQLWFSVTPPRDLAAGVHSGAVVVSGMAEPFRVPFQVRVFDVAYPERPRLHLGGWDYTDALIYGNTVQNRPALVAHLRERHVDSPWAMKSTLGYGTYDDQGRMTVPPDTAAFDAWVALWPDARRYHIFSYVSKKIAGTATDDPLFGTKIAAWIAFWVDHAGRHGIAPEQLVLLLVDESRNDADDALMMTWSKAIRAADSRLLLMDTGTRSPERNRPEVFAALDLLCPHRPTIFGGRLSPEIYREQVRNGKGLYLYSCNGPARVSDPYSYFRLQAWDAFDLGATGSFFWSFSGTGGADPWNPYQPKDTVWTPAFLDKDGVTTSKQMEAIAESVNDYEYLALLKDAVAEKQKTEPGHPALAPARALLENAVPRVVGAAGAREAKWETPKNRSLADAVRVEIGEMLERLNTH